MRSALAAGSSARNSKVAAACISCMTQAVAAFGPSVLAVKLVAQALPTVFAEAKDPKVKKQAASTALELYRWLGDAVMPLLEDVRDSQKKDLQKSMHW